ncbi:MAG TPA: hypothetical protein VEU30_02445 [Thermoanaerobaculia bacterium]|nr:hypothetical protein [Thermoanaerobaculia bacterium]
MSTEQKQPSSLPPDSSNVGSNSSSSVVPCHPLLALTDGDGWFAPVAERLRLVYNIKGLSERDVMLEVSSRTYSRTPIYSRALSQQEKADGNGKVIETWDGTLSNDTCPAGELRVTLCINPLFSPYTVRLYVADTEYNTRRTFSVFYEHLLMKMAPWSPGDAPDRNADLDKWTRYRLNQLGYFGGPWAADQDDYQKNAVINYKISHPQLYQVTYSDYNATVSQTMVDIIRQNDAPARAAFVQVNANAQRSAVVPGSVLTAFPSTDWPTTRGRRFIVYNQVSPTFNDELGEMTKAELKADGENREVPELTATMRSRLNRPLLPVEVDVHVRAKDSTPVFSPRAVGNVRIKWAHGEPWEDLTQQYADRNNRNSYPRKYVGKCLKLESGQVVRGTSNNCPETYGGIRKNALDNWDTPFLGMYDTLHRDADYVLPYCYSYAYTGATYPDRLGKAGVYFRPSKIAGDQYELVAYVDFRGRDNRSALEDAHAPLPIMTQSFPFQNRRSASFAALVQWPARQAQTVRFLQLELMGMPTVVWNIPAIDANVWNRVVAEFAAACIDLVPPTRAVGIRDVITNQEFVDIAGAFTGGSKPYQAASLRSEGMFRMKDESYEELINILLGIGGVWGRIQDALAARIAGKIHIDRAFTGDFILVDHLLLEPTRLRGNLTGNPIDIANYVEIIGSEGMGNGLAFVSQPYHAPAFFSISHELAHCLWLRHWENSGKGFAKDHDTDDHSCIMSYPMLGDQTYGPDVYDPHFCGKCNLKLRGWDVRKLPAKSS